MKKLVLFSLFICTVYTARAQSGNFACADAIQICLSQPITYPASTGAGDAEAGPDYGCLGSEPNPAWFYFRIDNPGTHSILQSNSTDRDLDFILYGPFASPDNWCTNLTAANTADCSYAGGTTETINFTSVTTGDYYLLMVTNFSNQATNVTFNQTSGTGTFDCNFTAPCLISLVSATPGSCDSTSNSFPLNGSVFTFNPPSTGTLTVSSQGVTQVINAPFANSVDFSLSGLPSNAAADIVTAVFSDFAGCSGTADYTAPSGCLPCQASALSNGPVCEGEDLMLTTDYAGLAQYQWTGPNAFTSTQANPMISNVSLNATGTYTVIINGNNCISEREVEVEVLGTPTPTITTPSGDFCEGDIIFLNALDLPGSQWSWTGPEGFTAAARNTQINNSSPFNSGWYSVEATRSGCTGTPDSLYVTVFPKPIISFVGDTNQVPGSSTVFSLNGASGNQYFWNFFGDEALMDVKIFTAGNDSLIIFWQDREGDLRMEVIAEDENGCTSDAITLDIHVTYAAGIAPLSNQHKWSIYPNPASGIAQFRNTENTSVPFTICDLSGRIIRSQIARPNSSTTIHLNGLSQGVYLIMANDSVKRLLVTMP